MCTATLKRTNFWKRSHLSVQPVVLKRWLFQWMATENSTGSRKQTSEFCVHIKNSQCMYVLAINIIII